MHPTALRSLALFAGLALSAVAADFDREIILTPHDGSAVEDREIRRWQEKAGDAAAKVEVYERLGWAYVTKARRTLDAGFHTLAEKTTRVMDAQFGVTPAAQLLRGHVWHNLHRFREAEAIARALVAEHESAAGYALLSDVLVEQGKLTEGIAAVQRLNDLKPGVEAYTRIAHVRWLRGDLPGAVAAMTMAAQAASPRDAEAGAWIVTRLSGLHLQAGDPTRALALADDALGRTAEFAPALLARGRALVALGQLPAAAAALERAMALNPLPEYQWWLADVCRALGRSAAAEKVEAALLARGAAEDPRTFALFLATRGQDGATAVRRAREELAQRQDVFSHDALAWALARNGELAAAQAMMLTALAEGTQDARLFLHAGEIARRAGRREEAASFLEKAQAAAGTLTPSERALLSRGRSELISSVVTQIQP